MKHVDDVCNTLSYGAKVEKLVSIIKICEMYEEVFNKALVLNTYTSSANNIEEYISNTKIYNKNFKVSLDKFIIFLELLYNLSFYIEENYAKETPRFTAMMLLHGETNESIIKKYNDALRKNVKFYIKQIDRKFVFNDIKGLYIVKMAEDSIQDLSYEVTKDALELLKDYRQANSIDNSTDRIKEKKKCLTQINIYLEKEEIKNRKKKGNSIDRCFNLLNNCGIRHKPQNHFLEKYIETLSEEDAEKICEYIYNLFCEILYYMRSLEYEDFIKEVEVNIAQCSKDFKNENRKN